MGYLPEQRCEDVVTQMPDPSRPTIRKTVTCPICGQKLPRLSMRVVATGGKQYHEAKAERERHFREKHAWRAPQALRCYSPQSGGLHFALDAPRSLFVAAAPVPASKTGGPDHPDLTLVAEGAALLRD